MGVKSIEKDKLKQTSSQVQQIKGKKWGRLQEDLVSLQTPSRLCMTGENSHEKI